MTADEILIQLKEDYGRRLNSLSDLLIDAEKEGIEDRIIRLKAKRSVYRSIYAEVSHYLEDVKV